MKSLTWGVLWKYIFQKKKIKTQNWKIMFEKHSIVNVWLSSEHASGLKRYAKIVARDIDALHKKCFWSAFSGTGT